jgi:3D (Asp-Asp-Asp) domain-containing protein
VRTALAGFPLLVVLAFAGGCDAEAETRWVHPDLEPGEPPPITPAHQAQPGASLGTFQITFYWIADENDHLGTKDRSIRNPQCGLITKVSKGFRDALQLEGTGRLLDGRVVNYGGSCNCGDASKCYFLVDADHPWGYGAQNRALEPFRSIAVDKSVIALGTWVYVEELDGVMMPGSAPWGAFVHDGCVRADDVGSAIDGKHFDFFAGVRAGYLALDDALGLTHATVRKGGERCTGAPVDDHDDDDDEDPGEPLDIVVDDDESHNDDAVASVAFSTAWNASSSTAGFVGSGYRYASTAAVADGVTFWFHLAQPGEHTVSARWTAGTNRTDRAPWVAFDADGQQLGVVVVDQTEQGAAWVDLATFPFTAGWNAVVLSRWAPTGKVVIADAIRVR